MRSFKRGHPFVDKILFEGKVDEINGKYFLGIGIIFSYKIIFNNHF